MDLIKEYQASSSENEDSTEVDEDSGVNLSFIDVSFSKQQPNSSNSKRVEIPSEELNIQLTSIKSDPSSSQQLTGKLSRQESIREEKRKSRAASRAVIYKNCNCKLECATKISKDQRNDLNNRYWQAGYVEKKAIILQYVKSCPIKRKRVDLNNSPKKTRMFEYKLFDERNETVIVCQEFFP